MNHPINKILYVDDEKENLDGFKYTFRKEYMIYLAQSAIEGLNILEDDPNIQVVITDQRMPGMSGVEFLENIISKYPESIRILLTGYSDLDATIQAINKGKIYQYISKPWKRDNLKIILDKAIEVYNLKKENQLLVQNLQAKNQELQKAKEKAEESDKLKTAFLANLSHEIRTPLTAINGLSYLMTSREFNVEDRYKYNEMIQESTNDLLMTMDDIIEFSKIETKQIEVFKNSFSVYSFLNNLYTLFQGQTIRKKKQDIQFVVKEPEDKNLMISTDEIKLKTILKKFLYNAFKFTEKGYVELGYDILENRNIKIYVKDTGIGIAQEDSGKIFERFIKVQSDEALYRGNGLGLSIAKGYADLLNLNISLESEIGIGSTFFIEIDV